MVIKVAKGGSMTSELYSEWLSEVFSKRHGAMFSLPSLMLVDQARSHKAPLSQSIRNVTTIFVPAGCTPILQPLDVSINKPFKAYVKEEWNEFIERPEEEQTFTVSGKRQRVCDELPHPQLPCPCPTHKKYLSARMLIFEQLTKIIDTLAKYLTR